MGSNPTVGFVFIRSQKSEIRSQGGGNWLREWLNLGGARLVENAVFVGAKGVFSVPTVLSVWRVGAQK